MKKRKDNRINLFGAPDDTLTGLDKLLEGAEESEASLDEILAEFSDQSIRIQKRTENQEVQPVMLRPEPPKEEPDPRVVRFPKRKGAPEPPEEEEIEEEGLEEELEPPVRTAGKRVRPEPDGEKVIPLWEEPENPVKAGMEDLLRRADEFSDAMFAGEDRQDPDADLAERYIPGTDEEEEARPPRKLLWERYRKSVV